MADAEANTEEPAAALSAGESQPAGGEGEGPARYGRCQVCRVPLPEPVRRADGRYKGGRRRLYCPPPKDCKERAHAMREARVAEALGDPLRMVTAVAEEAVPVMAEVQAMLARAIEGFAAITDVTSVQVAEVKADAEAARQEAEAARRQADQAEDRASQAAARGEQDRRARAEAEAQTAQARAEAAETRQRAAETVAAHQQASEHAERAATLARQAEQSLAARLEAATERLEEERRDRERLAAELARCRADLAAAQAELTAAHAATETARADARAGRERAETAEQQAAEAQRTAAANAAVGDRAERSVRELTQKLEDQRRETEQARADLYRVTAEVDGLRHDRGAARDEADRQRERAAQAEAHLQAAREELAARDRPPEDAPPEGPDVT
ncbi:hypothetical protein [Actinoallomurus iriomotensis]|uniref:Chromosome segregation ATPase n=1 Tax=Actinoallomurus iriomotensis TaxID=478107 RepID=A0A9W6VVT8_9ACTN|nr:hypothetical protein [Actinoallomurus iriomotensis]GLY87068.1 hypothetical protein Airi02_049970 [Actinoallomurus iriomotensis]